VDRTSLAQQVLRELEQWYRVFLTNEGEVLTAWKAFNITTGNRVTVSGSGEPVEGVAHDVDSEGRLIIRLDDGTIRTVAAGDVTILKRAGVA
jgi:BirA family biotin operon repressor/biotin-[acetyl-CoA-carboxylase] ligase